MAQEPTQNFKNHAKVVPPHHFVAGPILILNFVWTLIVLIRIHTFGSLVSFLVSIALIIMFLYGRMFSLKVQDRVIRPGNAAAPCNAFCLPTCNPASRR
jgi:uncharacterized membrane protein